MEKNYNTLEYYNKNAKIYFEQTVEADLKEIYDIFLSKIPKKSYILDFGCGSGRDSKFFIENGYRVKAIDGSIEMCKLASEYINQDVECMQFEQLDEENIYDAIWACSSIVHIEKDELPNILNKMIRALKPNGIIFVSFKKGEGYEIKEGKYYNFLDKEELEKILNSLNKNIKIIDHAEVLSSVKRPEKTIWSNYILMKENLEMIIFDLDGTLWETTDITYESANEIMKKHNISYEITKETVANTMGCSFEESAKNYMPDFDEEDRLILLKAINTLNSENLLKKGGHVYFGLEDVLIELKKKYKLAIVSNCLEGYINAFFKSSGFEKYFDDSIAVGDLKISKGEAIREIMRRNNVQNAIYVGDTLKDYEASKIADIEFIHARYGFGKNLNFKYYIDDIIELPKILEKI